MKAYDYKGDLFFSETDIDEFIENEIGGNFNNIDVMTTWQFEECWNDVEEIEVDANSFDTFKWWCYTNNLKPSHDESLRKYMEEVR